MSNNNYQDDLRALYDRLKSKLGTLEWLKPAKGKEITFRVLPYKRNDKGHLVFLKPLGGHFLAESVGPRSCARQMADERCPICEWKDQHMNDEDERKVAVARRLRVNSTFVANCLEYKGDGRYDSSIKLIRLSEAITKDILSSLEVEGFENMFDPIKGNNITIIGESTGSDKMNVRYRVKISPKSMPVSKTKEAYQELLKGVKDLDKIFGKIPDEEELEDALNETLHDKKFVMDAYADFKAMKEIWERRRQEKKEARSGHKTDNPFE